MITTIKFKKIFSSVAVQSGFNIVTGGWARESDIGIITLNLQKSNFSNKYDLNLKLFIHGTFKERYLLDEIILKSDIGNYFRRQPGEYDMFFDLSNQLSISERCNGLKQMFDNFISPFVEIVLSKSGLRTMVKQRTIPFLPAVEERLKQILEI